MLRASVDRSDRDADTAAIVDDDRDPLVHGGRELRSFVDALLAARRHDDPRLVDARGALADAVGPAGAARAATVTGNFEMMNRLLDAGGVVVPDQLHETGRELGVLPARP